MESYLLALINGLQGAVDGLWSYVAQLWSWLAYFNQWLPAFLTWLSNSLLSIVKFIWRGLQALLHAPFSSIWQKIKAIYDRYRRFRAWWQKNIQGPIEQMRRQILAIYRQYFKVIIDVIDTIRVGVRLIAVFNRKLAAKLDAKFWALESWILSPITRAMRTLNGMASIVYAILTATGRFDATVFIATVCRHIGEMRAALAGLPFKNTGLPVDDRPVRNAATAVDFHNWCQSGGTPIQDGVDAMTSEFQDAYTMIGSFHG